MLRKLAIIAVVGAALFYWNAHRQPVDVPASFEMPANALTRPLDVQIRPRDGATFHGEGRVTRTLSDDREGSRHQRFIVRLATGQTILIAHNIDLAPRVEGLKVGDTVEFSGEFESNPQGGVVHWTHRDPEGRHVAGWIRHDGRTYQ